MAAGAVSLKKSHDIIILSFYNIVKGQAYHFLEPQFIRNILMVFLCY